MQPEFHPDHALSFSADAVHLLRRVSSTQSEADWEILGSAEFASPSFRQDLADLRETVLHEPSEEPLPVVLVIPDDQILYTDLQVPTGEGRETAVGIALDGLTPYPIDQLAYDWRGDGIDIRVAAVARQTLLEAQEFANRHGFSGLEYTARPSDADYPGMPVFLLPEAQTDFDAIGEDLPISGLYHSGYAAGMVEETEDYLHDSGLNLDLDADLAELDPAFAEGADIAAPEAAAEEAVTDVAFTELGDSLAASAAEPQDGAEIAPQDASALTAEGGSEGALPEASQFAGSRAEEEQPEDAQIEELPEVGSDEAWPNSAFSDGSTAFSAPETPVPTDADFEPLDGGEQAEAVAQEPEAFDGSTSDATEAESLVAGEDAEQAAPDADEAGYPQDGPLPEEMSDGADAAEGSAEDQAEDLPEDGFAQAAPFDGDYAPADDSPEAYGAEDESANDPSESDFALEEPAEAADELLSDAGYASEDGIDPVDGEQSGEALADDLEHGGQSDEEPVDDAAYDAGQADGDAPDEDVTEDDDLTEAEREALAAAALEVAAVEAAAAAGQTVVRHGVQPSHLLNPRARAVRERAEEARRNPGNPGTAPAAAPRPVAPMRRRARGGKGELVVMLGALLVGLVLVWAFFAPNERPAETAMRNAERGILPTDGEAARATEEGQTQSPSAPATGNGQQVGSASSAMTPVERALVIAAATEPSSSLLLQDPVSETAAPDTAEPAETRTLAETPAAEATNPTAPTPAPTPAQETQAPAAPAEPAATAAAPTPVAPQAAAPAVAAPAAPAEPARTAAPTPAPAAAAPAPERRQAAPAQAPATAPAPAQTTRRAEPAAAPAPARSRALASSARPQSASAPRRRAAEPRVDTPPNVPSNPIPFEAAQRETARPAAVRPPTRPSARPAARESAPAATQSRPQPEPAASNATEAPRQNPNLRASNRPPSRPEGSVADPEGMSDELSPAEARHLEGLIRDLRASLPGAEVVARNEAQALIRETRFEAYAQARPARRPAAIAARGAEGGGGAVDAGSVDAAVRAANAPPSGSNRGSAMPAPNSGGLLHSSTRPQARPLTGGSRAASGSDAVEAAVASAVSEGAGVAPVGAGAVALTAIASSPLPPRRAAGAAVQSAVEAVAAAAAPNGTEVAALAPTAAPSAPAEGPSEQEQAERRRLDEQLQSQAEARVRARAQADAAAEAQARAQAEARARAQVAAEERAAAAQRQRYKPQEIDDEPEMAALPSGGATSASVATAATQKRGIDLGRTTIIGIIGAGNASRALIRLRSGKIVTVRLGDKIDGGTINSIGDGRVTYVKAGRTHELKLLDGR